MTKRTFTLEDLADEIKDASFVEWLVKPGEAVKEGQDLCEIVTDKASLVLSVPCDGRIAEASLVKGQKIAPASPLVAIESND